MVTELGLLELIRLRTELNLLAASLPALHELLDDIPTPEFYWDDTMTLENGILGKFYPSNRIHLPMWLRDESYKCLISTVAHELVHMGQYGRKGPLRWALANNPLWRRWTIEPLALQMERAAEDALGQHYMEVN